MIRGGDEKRKVDLPSFRSSPAAPWIWGWTYAELTSGRDDGRTDSITLSLLLACDWHNFCHSLPLSSSVGMTVVVIFYCPRKARRKEKKDWRDRNGTRKRMKRVREDVTEGRMDGRKGREPLRTHEEDDKDDDDPEADGGGEEECVLTTVCVRLVNPRMTAAFYCVFSEWEPLIQALVSSGGRWLWRMGLSIVVGRKEMRNHPFLQFINWFAFTHSCLHLNILFVLQLCITSLMA